MNPTPNTDPVPKGKVLGLTTMSLDGFIAGPNHEMDWVFNYSYPQAVINEDISLVTVIVCGRNSYDVGKRDKGKPLERHLVVVGLGSNMFSHIVQRM